MMPNPLVNFQFIVRRNTLLLGGVLILFRFVFLTPVVAIPSYLGSVKGYLPLQTGPVLLWLALPQLLCGLMAMYLLKYVDARLILTVGFGLVSIACFINAHLSPVWSGNNFLFTQLILAVGLAFAFNGLVGAIILEAINTGALTRPIDILTFAGYFQTVRLFGGEAGAALMQHFIPAREQFHSNILGLSVSLGQQATNQRLSGLSAAMASHSQGLRAATERAGAILSLQVRQQAFTLAIADSFMLLACAAIICLFIVACMRQVPEQYQQITVPAKAV
jgi:DHA2 family multidrug resistance protein